MSHVSRAVDVHPEELLDAARRGELDESGERRLSSHLEHCAACAVEKAAAADFDAAIVAAEGDERILAAIVEGALGRLETEPRVVARASRRTVWMAVAAALLVGLFGGAAAALWAVGAFDTSAPEPGTPPVDQGALTVPAQPAEIRAPNPSEPIPEISPEETPATTPGADEGAAALLAREPTAPRETAADLLTRANDARREDRFADAAALYRALQARFPRSREAAVSRVAHGRLLLDRLGDPEGAVRQFDRYLSTSSDGVLAEEARAGRALAFARLGRTAEERRAWEDLIRHHPASVHAERARRRLAQD